MYTCFLDTSPPRYRLMYNLFGCCCVCKGNFLFYCSFIVVIVLEKQSFEPLPLGCEAVGIMVPEVSLWCSEAKALLRCLEALAWCLEGWLW